MDIRENSCLERPVQPKHRLYKEAVESPFLGGFKSYVDVALGDIA